jgi:hypothetical protein
MSHCTDALTFLAMAVLAYTFRLRQANPYFLLSDYMDHDLQAIQMESVKSSTA